MVTLRENESFDNLVKRFKKEVDDAGILKEWRERQYFVKPSTKRHQDKMRAKRRALNSLREEREKERTRKGR
jgi:small subunit ribosomal protein S21